MPIDIRRPVCVSNFHCLRPESLRNSHLIPFSSFANLKSIDMNQPPGINQTTTTDYKSTLNQLDSQTLLNPTAELQTFVESFPLNSKLPSTQSASAHEISTVEPNLTLDQIRQRNRTRERAVKTLVSATRTTTRKDGHTQLLEAIRRCRLSKPGKVNTAARIGLLAVNGGKPLPFSSKKEIVGLPGLFDADLLAELTEEDRFLGPMKRAIINKDITSFNKLGSYMSRFWTKAAVVNNCVVFDNKLAIPEPLRQAVLSRLHRSHP